MSGSSFYNKVISYLAELNRGNHQQLVEGGWLSEQDEQKIIIILVKLGCIEKKVDSYKITRKGLNILLHQKIGRLGDSYDDKIILQLLSIRTNK